MNRDKKILLDKLFWFVRENDDAVVAVPVAHPEKPTKGWRQLAPKTRGDRQELMDKCGRDCFLDPDYLGFPICSREMDCRPHCAGILAAKVRAGQWKYPEIYKEADRLYRKRCS